jgi:hypothetical protein
MILVAYDALLSQYARSQNKLVRLSHSFSVILLCGSCENRGLHCCVGNGWCTWARPWPWPHGRGSMACPSPKVYEAAESCKQEQQSCSFIQIRSPFENCSQNAGFTARFIYELFCYHSAINTIFYWILMALTTLSNDQCITISKNKKYILRIYHLYLHYFSAILLHHVSILLTHWSRPL